MQNKGMTDKDLFQATDNIGSYDAHSIEVLEGLEPVRKRPGMYIGGTDQRAMHHLVSEVLDNSMDEAVAGFASRIHVEINADYSITIRDNGRGIPIDSHPKFPEKSALEVILCTLHAGGKFSGESYQTSGGLHGVGISVVNALSEVLNVEVYRNKMSYRQTFERGLPTTKLLEIGKTNIKSGTKITFKPDSTIFGSDARFNPNSLFSLVRSKAYLFSGVEIYWLCSESCLTEKEKNLRNATFRFPGGISDYLAERLNKISTISDKMFCGKVLFSERFKTEKAGSIEWSINWSLQSDGFLLSYCNTVPTPEGGTHETGFWSAILKGIKCYGELLGLKKISNITKEDITGGSCSIISIFIKDPEFVGQTKDRLSTSEAAKLTEGAVRDHFDNWLALNTNIASKIIEFSILKSDERLRRRSEKEAQRKTAVKKLRLPGKLTDCSNTEKIGSELFLVEGDSAGGSAKQARNRKTQAILPLRGKILNVLGAASGKMSQNQEILDLSKALGVNLGTSFKLEDLRYEKIIIMTDADVDGAHICALLMTLFFVEMRPLIQNGHLFLAVPPLYRITKAGKSFYAVDEPSKDTLLAELEKTAGKAEVSRFKGLGEMNPEQLRETTMDPSSRTLIRVEIPSAEEYSTSTLINNLMGKNPEMRYNFITKNAKLVEKLDV